MEEQLDSLSLDDQKKMSPDNFIIIIDDIVTRGVHMDACEYLLCDTDGYWIERLCLGRTVKLMKNVDSDKAKIEGFSISTDTMVSAKSKGPLFSMNPIEKGALILPHDKEDVNRYDDEYEYEYAIEK